MEEEEVIIITEIEEDSLIPTREDFRDNIIIIMAAAMEMEIQDSEDILHNNKFKPAFNNKDTKVEVILMQAILNKMDFLTEVKSPFKETMREAEIQKVLKISLKEATDIEKRENNKIIINKKCFNFFKNRMNYEK